MRARQRGSLIERLYPYRMRVLAGAAGIFMLCAIVAAANFLGPRPTYARDEGSAALVPVPSSQILGLTIANSGFAYLRGARVVSVGESSATVALIWHSAPVMVRVDWTPGTQYVDTRGASVTRNAIAAGDYLAINGHIAASSPLLTVAAENVHIVASSGSSAP